MTADIEVVELREIERGILKAVAKVRLGPLLVHGVRIIQQPGNEPWIGLPQAPSRCRADGSGSGWSRIVEVVDAAVLDQLRAAVLAAWRAAP